MSRKTVAHVRTGRDWRHVAPEIPRRRYERPASLREAIEGWCIPEPNSGCWLWLGSVVGSGYVTGRPELSVKDCYGVLSFQGRRLAAHRASYEAFVGPIPDDAVVRHRCDVSLCVNFEHLLAGTHQENVDDCVAKRRHTWGERHPAAKLDWNAVEAIRRDQRHVDEVAADHGVSRAQIYNIRNGERWGRPE